MTVESFSGSLNSFEKYIATIKIYYKYDYDSDFLEIKIVDIESGYQSIQKINKRLIMTDSLLESQYYEVSQIIEESIKQLLSYKVNDILKLKLENKKLVKENKEFKKAQDEKLPKLNRKSKRKIIVRG